MATQFYDRLSNDLTKLLESGVNYDVSIEVGDEYANIYKVHSIILQSRSPYFKKNFDEITFNEDHVKVLKLPNISVKAFDVIIKYIYGGKFSLEKLENSVIFDLLIASNELELDELVEHLQTHLINNCASWLRLKFAQIYRTSFQVKNLEIIQDFCNDIISKYPNTIFESEIFHSLPEDALISILKRDDLQLEEGKIWEYIIQWGKAKNPNLPTSLDKWTSDNFLTLKETLKQCLPYIRYFSISGEDVMEKIYPYQQLLEHQLFLDINTKFITPTNPISSIEISAWIDKRESPYIENYPYDFELLVRGSRDGFGVETIYNNCNKISKTIIVLKVEGTGEILGGYNPLEWDNDHDQRKQTKDSFIFSLKTANMKNSILSRVVTNFDDAIYNYPKFSTVRFSNALRLKDNLKTEKKSYCMACSTYPKLIRSDEFVSPKVFLPSYVSHEFLFSVKEYEVFKILPRNDLIYIHDEKFSLENYKIQSFLTSLLLLINLNFCNDIITKYPKYSENFHSLPEEALISILKRDNLKLEGKIWEYIIQWGKAKSPILLMSDKLSPMIL
ncbi:hypothetical protein Glove_185g22 [Diversispora epigaea]|uniref:BTB domain-containing protein n=1 Tax=Diversispora epigaea TaxID=1348612 RepID=A0A397IQ80_9GLOM|nr:hypothetical protein Glove_185g22 [Diversispora epigaea]